MTNKRVSRDEREILILAEFGLLVQENKEPELTAYALAKRMDMVVSRTLYAVLSGMVADGRLTTRQEELGSRCTRTFYRMAKGTYTMPDKTRVIQLKIGGKIYQEALWKG